MRCEDLHAHLADYLAGARTSATAAVAAHLRSCAACAAEVDGLRETWQLLDSVPAHQPDVAGMRARFDAALADYERTRETVRPRGWLPKVAKGSPLQPMAQVALAAAVLLLGVVIGRETLRPPDANPQIAALRQELRDMRQMVTLSLMQQQSASERLRGVAWTGQIDEPGSEVVTALLDTLMHDPNVNVRLASIDALKRFGERDVVRQGAVEALQRQTSPLVQIALVDFLVEVNGRQSADALRRLSQDPMVNDAVRARAAWGLQRVG